jgi:glycosyltransferase involved in cell wall biosynthesis
MDIVIITPSFLPQLCGMTFAALQHALLLRQSGNRVAVMSSCSHRDARDVARFLRDRDIDHLPVDIAGSGLFSRPVVGDTGSVMQSLVDWGAQVVLVEGKYSWGYHLIPAIKAKGFCIALLSHGSSPLRFEWTPRWLGRSAVYGLYYMLHERRNMVCVDSVGVLSAHEDRDRFRDASFFRRYGFHPIVVSNSSLEDIARGLRRVPGSAGQLRIALVGDMSDVKNQRAAIGIADSNDAIAFIRFYFPKTNSYSTEFLRAVDRACIANFEFRVGMERSAIMESLGDIDLIICLSKTEAQPLAIVDGLACGIPFLSTPVGCMESMKGGVVTEISQMPAVVRELAVDRGRMSRLESDAKEFYRANLSEEAVKPALVRLVSEALSATLDTSK